MLAQPTPAQLALKSYLETIKRRHNVSGYALAKEAGVSKQRIGHYLNPEPGGSMPRWDTLQKIARVAPDVPMPPELLPTENAPNGDGTRILAQEISEVGGDTDEIAFKPLTERECIFRVRTRALEMPPYAVLPGDWIKVDKSIEPLDGQAVVAVIKEGNSTSLVLRGYDQPYLVTTTFNDRDKRSPEAVDDKRIMILGPVVKLVRDTSI